MQCQEQITQWYNDTSHVIIIPDHIIIFIFIHLMDLDLQAASSVQKCKNFTVLRKYLQALKNTGSLQNGSKLNCNVYENYCKQWSVGYAKYKLCAVTFHLFQIVKLKNVPA